MPQGEARSDAVFGVVWIVAGILVVVLSLQMDRMEHMGATIHTAPGFVPGLLGICLSIFGVALMARGLRGRTISWREAGQNLSTARALGAIALLLAYSIGLVGRIPFWLATALFVTLFIFLFERHAPERQPATRLAVKALLVGAMTAAVVTFVFQEIFLVRLP